MRLENAGTATWRSRGDGGIRAAFHWLDQLGNPIVWDGMRTPFSHPVAPGEEVEIELAVAAPIPPGPYRLSFELIEEHRFWFSEIGCSPLEIAIDVAPRIAERRLEVRVHGGPNEATAIALAAQEEPIVDSDAAAIAHLVAGAIPPPEWSRILLDAHAEGWAAVGTAVVSQRRDRSLDPWAATGGRNPRFDDPLLLPSLLPEADLSEHLGLPAYVESDGLFDGRIAVTLPQRSGRRPT